MRNETRLLNHAGKNPWRKDRIKAITVHYTASPLNPKPEEKRAYHDSEIETCIGITLTDNE